jgi:hypothetical protein
MCASKPKSVRLPQQSRNSLRSIDSLLVVVNLVPDV